MRGAVAVVALVLLLPDQVLGGRTDAREPAVPGAAVPTNGQEVLPDLSDPGLEGCLRLSLRLDRRQRRRLHRADPIDGPWLTLLSRDYARVPMESSYDRGSKTLVLLPEIPMAQGQYTLWIREEFLRRRRPRPGNDGVTGDFLTSFSVGPDVHPPRILEARPAANQSGVAGWSRLSLLFNESIDPPTAVAGVTLHVEDAGAEPPMPVAGTWVLRSDGFLLEFAPDPVAGYPPGTRIRVTIRGGTGSPALLDRAGNPLEEDFVLEFDTAGP